MAGSNYVSLALQRIAGIQRQDAASKKQMHKERILAEKRTAYKVGIRHLMLPSPKLGRGFCLASAAWEPPQLREVRNWGEDSDQARSRRRSFGYAQDRVRRRS